MKILIVSDTHRHNENFLKVLEKTGPIDMLIHCGDVEGSEYLIASSAGCPVQMVMGNNDFFSDLPREKEFQIGKYKVWLTHGHTYYVSMGEENIVMFGHSHRPIVDIDRDIIAVNPGSLTYPRQEGRKPSYIIMELDSKGEAHFTICYLDE